MLEGEGSGVSCCLGQLEFGVRRNPRLSPDTVAAVCETGVGSLTWTEDCGRYATWAYSL